MTREDIIRMASQAARVERHFLQNWINHGHAVQYLEKFAALVAAAERERCAELIENYERFGDTRDCAAAIRELK